MTEFKTVEEGRTKIQLAIVRTESSEFVEVFIVLRVRGTLMF